NVVISDTIGFIQNLPPTLIESFKSTLMESLYADIILHVIDVSDERMEAKVKTVQAIIKELGLASKKQMYVFNKTDQLNGGFHRNLDRLKSIYADFTPQFVSVKTKNGIINLKSVLLSSTQTTLKNLKSSLLL
ncbi:hypothetical protein HYW87_05030, partial [Candidatus Roizmanbacteria bacterium]|nr:hypothetical protein [Candidatus Roizmanbacteria bacterium]